MGLYTTVMDGITEYTGQSPAAFFTILAMTAVVYKLACGKFVAAGDFVAVKKDNAYALREPIQLGENVTQEQLRAYDGSDPEKPLLTAIKGQIYDVSPSRRFYGPGAPYAVYAGRDASRAFALLSFEPKDITGNIEGLSASELDVLQGWEDKYMEKYVKVGQLVGAERNQIETEPTENGDKIQEAKHIEENGTQQPPTSE